MAKKTDSLKNYMNDHGIKVALNGFAVSFFNGTVPASPADAVTGSLLITFTVNNDGVTGGTWSTSSGGVLQRTSSENISGTCLLASSPTHYRVYILGESPTTASSVFYREQGTCGQVGTDAILDSTYFPMVLSTVYPLGNIVESLV